jgi:hypothetical protein
MLRRYEGDWVTMDFLRIYLSNTSSQMRYVHGVNQKAASRV